MRSDRACLAAAAAAVILAVTMGVEKKGEARGMGGRACADSTTGVGAGPNGLLPRVYMGTAQAVDTFLQVPLPPLSSPPPPPPPQLQVAYDNLLAQAQGIAGLGYPRQGGRLLEYVISCALPWGQPFPVLPYTGEGILTPPGTQLFWPGNMSGPDAVARREDIHTCMISRLNAFGFPVPILFSGPHVTPPDAVDVRKYPFPEAVWLATVEPSGLRYDVWPLDGLVTSCAGIAREIIDFVHFRVCGAIAGETCGVTVHTYEELVEYCEPFGANGKAEGRWLCGTTKNDPAHRRPAIETRLSDCILYELARVGSKIGVCKHAPPPPAAGQCGDASTRYDGLGQ
jgi:hypothetical protein